MKGRKRIYKDDKLVSKCLRLSLKYEWDYVLAFVYILRKFRKQAIAFVERYKDKEQK